jgi:hypothetical protein
MKQQLKRAEDLKKLHKCFERESWQAASPWALEFKLTDFLAEHLKETMELQVSQTTEGCHLVTQMSIECSHADSSKQQDLLLASVPNTWESFYKSRGIAMQSPAALALHTPMTILHCASEVETRMGAKEGGSILNALRRKKKKRKGGGGGDDCKGEICIHVLGADEEFTFSSAFAELASYFPNTRMKVVFVGPNIPNQGQEEILYAQKAKVRSEEGLNSGSTLQYNLLCHKSHDEASSIDERTTKDAAVQVFALSGFYHELGLDEIGGRPDLIFAQNAGLAAYTSWVPTVQLIIGLNRTGQIPFLCTDYCEEAALRGVQMLEGLGADSACLIQARANRFMQPLKRTNRDNALPSYSNGFLYGLTS